MMNPEIDSQVSALKDLVFALDLKTMNREQLLRLAMTGRYMVTQADEQLTERDGGLNI